MWQVVVSAYPLVLATIVAENLSVNVEQRCVIIFTVKNVKSALILRSLQVVWETDAVTGKS